jgi:hypothetical protein
MVGGTVGVFVLFGLVCMSVWVCGMNGCFTEYDDPDDVDISKVEAGAGG